MTRFATIAMITVAFMGCGDAGDQSQEAAPEAGAAPAAGTVTIVQPADGAELDAGPVLFVLETDGVEIVAAGNMDAGTGHHHLIVDGDVDWKLPIPNDAGVHYHMGQAETEYTLTDLTPGEHRIIAVVADGVHIPLDPPVSDTITVVIR
ncbi:MAG: DUF4399 domain-containing protein [Gemmatimonadota bacterium]|nr:DUF4399 domain-containing protein [Gemmatimonadota bacterium]